MHTAHNILPHYLTLQHFKFWLLCAATRVAMASAFPSTPSLNLDAISLSSPSPAVASVIAVSQTTLPLVSSDTGQARHNYLLNPLLGDDGQEEHEHERTSSTAFVPSVAREDSDFTKSSALNHMHTTKAYLNAQTGASSVNSNGKDETLRPPGSGFTKATRQSTGITPTASTSMLPMPSSGPTAASGSSSTLNSWKIIGIGVLAFAAIVALILGFAFHDALLRSVKVCLHGRRRAREDTLVPDWNRGSWRYDTDNPIDSEKDVNNTRPRISLGEKGSLQHLLPPVSPFPLRRNLSTATVANATSIPDFQYARGQRFSMILSPLTPHTPPKITVSAASRAHTTVQLDKSRISSSPRLSSDSDAYGGMMDSKSRTEHS